MSEKEWQELRLLKCTAIKPFKEKENKVNPVAIHGAGSCTVPYYTVLQGLC